jgi:hypothetical protein
MYVLATKLCNNSNEVVKAPVAAAVINDDKCVMGSGCRDISIEIDDGSAMVNAMGAQKAKDYKCLG